MVKNKAPLASMLVAFYNQVDFVSDTVKGALGQTYSNLEIIFSDDCSTDGTFQAIQDAVKDYKGPHRVILNRNEPNMGLVPHVNKELFELSHGELIFLNGGDDISLPKRVELGVNYFLKHDEVSAVTFSRITIDKKGNEVWREKKDGDVIQSVDDKAYLFSSGFMTRGVGLSFRRSLLNVFGPLSNDCQTEDSTLRFRAMLVGKTLKSGEYGLKYRMHDNNMSRNIFKLKTSPIAEQYRQDLIIAQNIIGPKLYDVLETKIEFYKSYREIDNIIYDASFFMKMIWKMRRVISLRNYRKAINLILNSHL